MIGIVLALAATLPVLAVCIYVTFALGEWAVNWMSLPGWMAFAFCVELPMLIGTFGLGFYVFCAVSGYGVPWS